MTEFNNLFAPESVAFLGASSNPGKWGFRIMSNIVSGGYRGRLYPVNPKGGEMMGVKIYTSIEEIPETPDLVAIAVPPPDMIDTIKRCVRKGIKAGIVITAGFAEVDSKGAETQEEIVRLAREGGMRLIGPNCFGLLSTPVKLYAQMPPIHPPEGPMAVLSQSGNVGLTIARRSVFGVSRVISTGNEADLHAEDFLEYLAADDKTKVILSYIEGFKDGRRFFKAAQEVGRKKPIIMIKVGETEAGASAAKSHTAALSGSAEVFAGVSRQAGIVKAHNLTEMLNLSYGFLCHPVPAGKRVGIATLGGGWGVLAADACARLGLDVVKLPPDVMQELDSFLPAWWSRNNPVDLVAGGKTEDILRVVEVLAKSDCTDAVLTLGIPIPAVARQPMPQTDQEKLQRYISIVEAFGKSFLDLRAISEKYGKPVLAAAELPSPKGAATLEQDVLQAAVRHGCFCYSMPDEAAAVLSAMVRYGEFLRRV